MQEATDATAKAEGLKASLQEQMQEAKQEVAHAAAAVQTAQDELATAQHEAQELLRQQQALQEAESKFSSEVASMRNELSQVLTEVSAGRMSHEEAEEFIEQVTLALGCRAVKCPQLPLQANYHFCLGTANSSANFLT